MTNASRLSSQVLPALADCIRLYATLLRDVMIPAIRALLRSNRPHATMRACQVEADPRFDKRTPRQTNRS